jgi:putative DNA primase/helicase
MPRVEDFPPNPKPNGDNDIFINLDEHRKTKTNPKNGDAEGWKTWDRPQPKVEVTLLKDVIPEPVSWIWPGWLARGKLHIMAGPPEAGKTTVLLSLSATISAGGVWPDGSKASEPGFVLIWTNEDSVEDTIAPRLLQMGADTKRVAIVRQVRKGQEKPRPFNPSVDMPLLVETAKKLGKVDLLMIDPVVAAVPPSKNSHSNAETRAGLQPVVDFAEAADCAVVGISHFTKGTGGKDPIERVTGSLAFGALPRIVFAVAKNKADEVSPPRVFIRAKSNIGLSGGGYGFDIVASQLKGRPDIVATKVEWGEPLEGTAKELLADAEEESKDADEGETRAKEGQAVDFLQAVLSGGPMASDRVRDEAMGSGISWRTLCRAKKKAKVKSVRPHGEWMWMLRRS